MRSRVVAALLLSWVLPSATMLGAFEAQPAIETESVTCEPVFQARPPSRVDPYLYVDQALEAFPRFYPKHVLLLQRRLSLIGNVSYSLLVYRKDREQPIATIDGMATMATIDGNQKSWFFAAQCPSDRVLEGVVKTLEEIARLPESEGKPQK
jgi:hypothetical protein